jgi:hypothetical protein
MPRPPFSPPGHMEFRATTLLSQIPFSRCSNTRRSTCSGGEAAYGPETGSGAGAGSISSHKTDGGCSTEGKENPKVARLEKALRERPR